MNNTTETTPVIDYILSSEKNLLIAEAVHSSWESAKGEIANGFCNRLIEVIQKTLPEWEFGHWDFLVSKRGAFTFWKPGWDDQYSIHLQPENYGSEMTYGLLRHESNVKGRPFSPELLEAIQQRVPSAKSKSWWEALIKLQSPAADWTKPEVLWRIHADNKFLEEVAVQLLEIAEVSEKIVDSLVAQYQEKKESDFDQGG